LACLSAMTNTSEGPAGMSIEIMASLFCKGNRKGERERERERESQIEMRNICIYSGSVHLYLNIKFIQVAAMISVHTWRIIFAAVTY